MCIIILFQGRAFFFSILFIYSFRKALCFFRLPHLKDACMVLSLSLCSPPNLLFSSWSDPRQPCFGGPCKGALNLVLWENDRIGKKASFFNTFALMFFGLKRSLFYCSFFNCNPPTKARCYFSWIFTLFFLFSTATFDSFTWIFSRCMNISLVGARGSSLSEKWTGR